jgi:hypothetical protein
MPGKGRKVNDMTEELKRCPFCNKPADRVGIRVRCNNNECPNGFRIPLSVMEWNTRPIEDALRATIAERDAEIERLKGYIEDKP